MLSFMHAQYGFFQQGYTLLQQLQPYMKKLASEVSRTVGWAGGWAPYTLLTLLLSAGPTGD